MSSEQIITRSEAAEVIGRDVLVAEREEGGAAQAEAAAGVATDWVRGTRL